jgi:hypothetical protein
MDRKSIVICFTLLFVSVVGLQISTGENLSSAKSNAERQQDNNQLQQHQMPSDSKKTLHKSTSSADNRSVTTPRSSELLMLPHSKQSIDSPVTKRADTRHFRARQRNKTHSRSSRNSKTRYVLKRTDRS